MNITDKPPRLYEFKILYKKPGWSVAGEHYYMCEAAEQAVLNHAVISEQHGRGLKILTVHKKNPFSNVWEDETLSVRELIEQHNSKNE